MSVSPVSGGATGELIQIGARTTRSTDLSIVTAQGDKVTISASATHGVGYAAATGSSDGVSLTAGAVSVSDSSSLSISVEGDLNRRELHDINKVVRALQRAAARGDASRLLDRLSQAHLRSLSTISGSITTQTVVTAQQIQGSQQPAAPADSAPPASSDTPPVPSGSPTPPPVAASAPATAEAPATTDAPAPAAPASQTPMTLKAPVVQKTLAAGAPGVPPPRAPKIEDFMFTILKALLNPNGGATASVAPASTPNAETSDELKAA